MKVKELIEQLEILNKELEVRIENFDMPLIANEITKITIEPFHTKQGEERMVVILNTTNIR